MNHRRIVSLLLSLVSLSTPTPTSSSSNNLLRRHRDLHDQYNAYTAAKSALSDDAAYFSDSEYGEYLENDLEESGYTEQQSEVNILDDFDDEELSDYTLYYHEYEFDWENEADWFEDEDYAAAKLPHACTHEIEIIEHKLCIIGKTKKEAVNDLKDPHHEVAGHPLTEKNGGFVINFKKQNGAEKFHLKHINGPEMQHLFYRQPHPHIMNRDELEQAIKNGKLNQFGNNFHVTYHGMVFDFTKDKDWRKIGSHHSPRYMDNKNIRPKVVQNNDPAPQVQDRLDDIWQELDHYNHFEGWRTDGYARRRYKGPKLVIPPGTQKVVCSFALNIKF